jgi:PAS domain S-box-containing protein
MVQILGYPSLEALQATDMASTYVNPEERTQARALAERDGVAGAFESQLRRYDGKVIWVRQSGRAVKDEQGKVLYYEGTLEDITDRKRFEEELQRQKDYFEALFTHSPVAVVTADLDANVVSWNPMAEKLFGYTPAEAIGQHIDALVANDDSIRVEAAGYTDQLREQGRVQMTTRRSRKDGSLVDVELLALPLVLAGELVGFYGMYHDISERKRFERELRHQKEYFEALFVNNPVAVVTVDPKGNVVSWNPSAEKLFGYTQAEAIGQNVDDLVARDDSIRAQAVGYTDSFRGEAYTGVMEAYPEHVDDLGRLQVTTKRTRKDGSLVDVELQQENLAIINRSGEHLLALINDVLEMSKIEAGRVNLQETRSDLYGLLDSLEEMFRLRAQDKGLTLSVRRAGNVPHYVVTDEGKLRQVLSNLLGNAVKFTQEGSVALRVRAFPSMGEDQVLHFDVEDTGPGIAPEDLEAVFDPFVQAVVGQEPQEGTGLGLAISRQFVRLMGGDITASSEPGQGSLFRFDVQVGSAEVPGVEAIQPKRRVLALAPDQLAPDGEPFRLLVVEDSKTNRRLLVKLLDSLGFEVQEAANGQEAVEIWERWDPHLMWMDMRMPVLDGHQATQQIKATHRGQATVIIALTATAFEEDREEILLEGCDDFVRKPFRKDEIYDMLAKHLGVRFLYEEGPVPGAPGEPSETAAPAPFALSPEALFGLPAIWVAELQQATTRADLHSILSLADQIRGQDAALADTLAELAQNYEYRKILNLIEQSGG